MSVSIRVDFSDPSLQRRVKQLRHQKELLLQATGLYKNPHWQVCDATAGFGEDAYLMAVLSPKVLMMEQHPVVFALLHAEWQRAYQAGDPQAQRMQVIGGNAIDYWSSGLHEPTDVVYLDPIYPDSGKSSLREQSMRALKQLLGPEMLNEQAAQEGALLEAARSACIYRVVVKRPRKAPLLSGQAPNHQILGRSIRYDIYLGTAHCLASAEQ